MNNIFQASANKAEAFLFLLTHQGRCGGVLDSVNEGGDKLKAKFIFNYNFVNIS